MGASAQFAGLVETIRRMVGRNGLQIAERKRLPQRVLIGDAAWRRAAHPLGALYARLIQIGGGEKQILRTGLGEDLQALPARVTDHLGAFRRRDVKDYDRMIDDCR